MSDEEKPTAAELAEARRVLDVVNFPGQPHEYTCHGCPGRKLISECGDDEIDKWADLRKFNPRAKTLCAFAWDPYNTNGDCLASK